MDFLPISVRITDGSILLVGSGREAVHKATVLSRFTDKVTVVAPEIPAALRKFPFRFIERDFETGDLDDVTLLFIATGDKKLNHHIKDIASEHGVLACVCDDTAWCDFVSPAIARPEGDNITIAVGSDSRDVRRAIRVRNRINELISDNTLDIS
jgi:siroheme synthase-like protein